MSEYIERDSAVCIADYAADEHPYGKDMAKPETFSEYNQGWNDACDYIRDKLESEPAANVVPVELFNDLRNELCLHCGKYTLQHFGACDGCKWRADNG